MAKQLSQRQNIAESKKAFHQIFPYVIPPLYRRIADELLVELHLLKRHQSFKVDTLFVVGLVKAFETFTSGYKPTDHVKLLFDAICRSTGFDSSTILIQGNTAIQDLKKHSINEVKEWLEKGDLNTSQTIKDVFQTIQGNRLVYSRLQAIGLHVALGLLKDSQKDESELKTDITDLISQKIGIPVERAKKDIDIYKASIEKMSQSIELMKEIKESQRKKRAKKDQEDNTGIKNADVSVSEEEAE